MNLITKMTGAAGSWVQGLANLRQLDYHQLREQVVTHFAG